MIEYAQCIYRAWAEDKTPEYIRAHEQEVLAIISRALGYTTEEVYERIHAATWYLH